MNGEQISGLSVSAVAALSAAQFNALSAAALTGLGAAQSAILGLEQLATLDNETIRTVNDSLFKGLTAEALAVISMDALAVLRAEQFVLLPETAFAGLSAVQLAALPVELVALLTASALENFADKTIAGLSPSQLQRLPVTALAGWDAGHLAHLSALGFQVLTPEHIKQLRAVAWQSINAAQVAELSLSAVQALTPEQIAQWPDLSLVGLSAAQLGSLQPTALAEISETQLSNLTQFSQLDKDQIAAFDAVSLSGLTAAQISVMPATAFAGLSAEQVTQIPPDSFLALTAAQLTKMLPSTFATLDPFQLTNIPPEAFAGLTAQQLTLLSGTVVAGLTAAHIKQLSGKTTVGLTPAQVSSLDINAVIEFSSAALAGFGAETIQSTPRDIFFSFNPTAFHDMPNGDISRWLVNLAAGLFLAEEFDTTLLPTGWAINKDTGIISPPINTDLAYRVLTLNLPSNLSLPAMADLSLDYALGGTDNDDTTSALIELNTVVDLITIDSGSPFDLVQTTDGIVQLKDTSGQVLMAFMVALDGIYQTGSNALSGVAFDENGAITLTTASAKVVSFIPVLSDPRKILATLSTTGSLYIGAQGETRIQTIADAPTWVALARADIQPATVNNTAAGVFEVKLNDGRSGLHVVYLEGNSQTLQATLQSSHEFSTLALAFSTVENVRFNRQQGGVRVNFKDGRFLGIEPALTITPTAKESLPDLLFNGGFEWTFINSSGDQQQFFVR